MAQTFMTRLFIQLRIPHGGMDSDLVRDLDQPDPQFPADTLRPGAMWFLKQLDFPTSLDYSILTEKVVKLKTHLDLVLKVSGTFFEQMELADFPFDVQRLTVTLAINTATEGIVPVAFSGMGSGRSVALSINLKTFAMSNMWRLYPHLGVSRTTIEPMPNTTYPALSVASLVQRRAAFVTSNVFLPVGVLTLLSLLQFLLPGDFDASGIRITFSITILLTSATYKLFVSTTMPAVGYMTLCDKYIMYCFLLQAAVVAEGAICGALVFKSDDAPTESPPSWVPRFATSVGDYIAFLCCAAFFVAFHLHFALRSLLQRRRKLAYELGLFELCEAHMDASPTAQQAFDDYRETTSRVSSAAPGQGLAPVRRRSVTQTLGLPLRKRKGSTSLASRLEM